MQTVPLEQIRMSNTQAAGIKKGITHGKEPLDRDGEKRESSSPLGKVMRLVTAIEHVINTQTAPQVMMCQAQV